MAERRGLSTKDDEVVGYADYEDKHVHQVYEQIASHFSSTRYKALTTIAKQHRSHSAIVADNLHLPHPRGRFDFAISIAVIHHVSTSLRRVAAIKEVLDLLKPRQHAEGKDVHARAVANGTRPNEGRALFYVWALEQKGSRRGWDAGGDQDVMVPWIVNGRGPRNRRADVTPVSLNGIGEDVKSKETPKTFNRYYHLYRSGELEDNIVQAGGVVLSSGYERDNWWAIAAPQRLVSEDDEARP
ncbi:MAG: tRNA methyltransferase, has a role in tRNA modification [Sclerophora amabilis]|nr:MAG: tRNA methyltransferase, has a role in tRNA modification [Sclerophora amabilis]